MAEETTNLTDNMHTDGTKEYTSVQSASPISPTIKAKRDSLFADLLGDEEFKEMTENKDEDSPNEYESKPLKKGKEDDEQIEHLTSMSTTRDMRKNSIYEAAPAGVQDYIFNPVKSSFFSDRDWDKFLYENRDRDDVREVIDLIGEYAEEESYFDIYQICAFDSMNDRKAYKSSFVQAMLCLILQLPSIIFIVYGEWVGSDKEWCNNIDKNDDILGGVVSKVLAFGYSLYVSFYIEDMFANKKRGMRCVRVTDLSNNPDFLNGLWLRVGSYYNNFASYCATVASFVIIFFAESQIDLVLNALALFFLIEIDDLLVTRFDYWKIKEFIEDVPMRNKVGFRVIDVDGDEGVRIRNVKSDGPAYSAILEGDIITGIEIAGHEVMDEYDKHEITTKASFVQCYEEILQNSTEDIKLNIKRKVKKNEEAKTFSVTITMSEADDSKINMAQDIASKTKGKCNCEFWKGYQYYVDFPIKTIILFVRFFAPFYVGICS